MENIVEFTINPIEKIVDLIFTMETKIRPRKLLRRLIKIYVV